MSLLIQHENIVVIQYQRDVALYWLCEATARPIVERSSCPLKVKTLRESGAVCLHYMQLDSSYLFIKQWILAAMMLGEVFFVNKSVALCVPGIC